MKKPLLRFLLSALASIPKSTGVKVASFLLNF